MTIQDLKNISDSYTPYERIIISVQMALNTIHQFEANPDPSRGAYVDVIDEVKEILNTGLGFTKARTGAQNESNT